MPPAPVSTSNPRPGVIAARRLRYFMEVQKLGATALMEKIGGIPQSQRSSFAAGISQSKNSESSVTEEKRGLYERGLRVPVGTLDGSNDLAALKQLMTLRGLGINAEKLAKLIKESRDDEEDLAGQIAELLDGTDSVIPDNLHEKMERKLNVFRFTLQSKPEEQPKIPESPMESNGVPRQEAKPAETAKPATESRIDSMGQIHRPEVNETKPSGHSLNAIIILVRVGETFRLGDENGLEIDNNLALELMWKSNQLSHMNNVYRGAISMEKKGNEYLFAIDKPALNSDMMAAILWTTLSNTPKT